MRLPDLTKEGLPTYLAALERLHEDSPGTFGSMDATAMVCHLRHTLEVSLGEVEDPPHHNWFTRTVGRVLFFHLLTRWPGGFIRQPAEWTPRPEGAFDTEYGRLVDTLHRFGAAVASDPDRMTVSPLLGPLTIRYWAYIHAVHFAHHFRQFSLSA